MCYLSVLQYISRREKHILVHANNKGADQPAHLRSMISGLVLRSLEMIIDKFATCNISIF